MLNYFHCIENTELNSSSSAVDVLFSSTPSTGFISIEDTIFIFRSCVPIEKLQVCSHLKLSVHCFQPNDSSLFDQTLFRLFELQVYSKLN